MGWPFIVMIHNPWAHQPPKLPAPQKRPQRDYTFFSDSKLNDSVQFISLCDKNENYIAIGCWDMTLRIFKINDSVTEWKVFQLPFFPINGCYIQTNEIILLSENQRLLRIQFTKDQYLMEALSLNFPNIEKMLVDDQSVLYLVNRSQHIALFNTKVNTTQRIQFQFNVADLALDENFIMVVCLQKKLVLINEEDLP